MPASDVRPPCTTSLPKRVPAANAEALSLVLGSMAAVAAFLLSGLFEYNFGDTEVLLAALAVMALPFVVERDLSGSPQLRE